jgi:hypothetical protein
MYIGLWFLSAGHVSILLHPQCTPGPSPCIYKRKGQGPHTKGGRARLPLSLANACNPYSRESPATSSARDAAPFQESRVHVPRRQLRHGTPSSAARQRQRRPSARPAAVDSATSSPRGGRAASEFVPSPSSPQEEEVGQSWPSRRRHLVGCRASRRRRHPSGGHVGR